MKISPKIKTTFLYSLGIIIGFMVSSCKSNEKQDFFELKGTVDNDLAGYIYLKYGSKSDSSLVTNKTFYFKGKAEYPIAANLTFGPISSMDAPFYLENTSIDMDINVDQREYKGYDVNFIKVNDISGTKTNLMQTDFEVFKTKYSDTKEWRSKLFLKIDSITKLYPKHHYSADLVSEFVNDSTIDIKQVKILYKNLDSLNPSKFSMEYIRRIIEPLREIHVGNTIIDFKLPNKDAITINTTDYRGSMLLIDFWASWCAPCRKQNVVLSDIYKSYQDKNFKVLGVSFDTNYEKWISALEEDKLEWDNVVELDGMMSKIGASYNITFLPSNVLFDENGVIIAVDISMEDLKNILEESTQQSSKPFNKKSVLN